MIAQLEDNLPVGDVSPTNEHAHAINPSIPPARIVLAFYEAQPRGFLPQTPRQYPYRPCASALSRTSTACLISARSTTLVQ